MIVAPLGLETRLVTELTVDLELRGCGHGTVNDELVRGEATTFACSRILDMNNNIMPIDNEFDS